jgi:hypothetical protein
VVACVGGGGSEVIRINVEYYVMLMLMLMIDELSIDERKSSRLYTRESRPASSTLFWLPHLPNIRSIEVIVPSLPHFTTFKKELTVPGLAADPEK